LNYKIFFKGDQPLIAIPTGISFKHSIRAINCLPSFTFKRKVYKVYLYILSFLGHFININILNNHKYSSLKPLLEWFDKFKESNPNQELYPIFIWSLVPNRKRYYIHLLNKSGEKIFFAKLTNSTEDHKLLKTEFDQLINWQNSNNIDSSFSTPQVIGFEKDENYSSLIVESLKDTDKLFHPSNNKIPEILIKEIQGTSKKIQLNDIFEMDWWKRFDHDHKKMPNLHQYIKNVNPENSIKVSFVHGDFGSENILTDKSGKFKIIDWERATENGPYHLDTVAYWLGKHHKEIKNNSNDTIQQFYSDFEHLTKIDLALCLSFLIGANFNLAFIISTKFQDYR